MDHHDLYRRHGETPGQHLRRLRLWCGYNRATFHKLTRGRFREAMEWEEGRREPDPGRLGLLIDYLAGLLMRRDKNGKAPGPEVYDGE